MAGKSAAGVGSIRKKTVTRKGKTYTYWEARYTAGYNPGTGRQIQRSITGKTQKEVSQKLKAATTSIDNGTYIAPNKMRLGEWLDIWVNEFLGSVKPYTVASYTSIVRNHIQPALGSVRLDALQAHTIQGFYNALGKADGSRAALAPKTIKGVHGVLHKALQKAVEVGYLRVNPTDACALPRVARREITPLCEEEMRAFLSAIAGHPFESLFVTALFSGMREGEVLGLMWNCVDFERGTIYVDKQLQKEKKKGGQYLYVPLKNDKARIITPAKRVMDTLHIHKAEQNAKHLLAGEAWEDTGLVFTNDIGGHLAVSTVYKAFKAIAASIGRPDARFHDLRHSYAVASIRAGDDIKTVQNNLGHATASFTLDVYGHVTEQMRAASAARMDAFIAAVLDR